MRNLTLMLSTLLLSPAAHACGGLFCGPTDPVDQAGESILFAVDEEAGEVTVHVQIQYVGPAEEFAWVLPTPAQPELDIGKNAVFTALGNTRARFNLVQDTDGCVSLDYASNTTSAGGGGGGVTIIASEEVGPYETVTLQANSSAELLTWLQDNNFNVPTGMDPVLAPYVAEGSYFVALRLAKDKDAGDLEPLVMTYAGTQASIPIQLTSIAATPDMRLRVYVLGDERSVPESYLHVQINELAVDWWSRGANLEEVITMAADEAGGQAFFTDYSGPTDLVENQVFLDGWDQANLEQMEGVGSFLQQVVNFSLPLEPAMMDLLVEHTGLPLEGTAINLTDTLNCLAPGYYGYAYYDYEGGDCNADYLASLPFDAVAAAADIEVEVLGPRRRAEALFAKHTTLTRMTSSVSPVDMTVDPTFVFNPDMGPVEQTRNADEIYHCGEGDQPFDAERTLVLSDGREVDLPSQRELSDLGLTEIEWLAQHGLTTPVNAVIERTGSSGEPEVLTDNRGLLADQLESYLNEIGGCGCSSAPTSQGWLVLGLIGLLIRRRS